MLILMVYGKRRDFSYSVIQWFKKLVMLPVYQYSLGPNSLIPNGIFAMLHIIVMNSVSPDPMTNKLRPVIVVILTLESGVAMYYFSGYEIRNTIGVMGFTLFFVFYILNLFQSLSELVERLEAQYLNYKNLVDFIHGVLITMDDNLIISYANKDLLNFKTGDLVGKNIQQYPFYDEKKIMLLKKTKERQSYYWKTIAPNGELFCYSFPTSQWIKKLLFIPLYHYTIGVNSEIPGSILTMLHIIILTNVQSKIPRFWRKKIFFLLTLDSGVSMYYLGGYSIQNCLSTMAFTIFFIFYILNLLESVNELIEKVQEQFLRYKNLVEFIHGVFIIVDEKLNISFTNNGILDLKQEDLEGKNLTDFPFFDSKVIEELKRTKERQKYEWSYVNTDGETSWYIIDYMENFFEKEENQGLILFTMFDLFQESLQHHQFVDFYPDFDYSKQTELEYIIEKHLSVLDESIRKKVSVFIHSGFDQERIDFLTDLIKRKFDGETFDGFYPYLKKKKLIFPDRLKDLLFQKMTFDRNSIDSEIFMNTKTTEENSQEAERRKIILNGLRIEEEKKEKRDLTCQFARRLKIYLIISLVFLVFLFLLFFGFSGAEQQTEMETPKPNELPGLPRFKFTGGRNFYPYLNGEKKNK
eukprot:gene12680-6574_t